MLSCSIFNLPNLDAAPIEFKLSIGAFLRRRNGHISDPISITLGNGKVVLMPMNGIGNMILGHERMVICLVLFHLLIEGRNVRERDHMVIGAVILEFFS